MQKIANLKFYSGMNDPDFFESSIRFFGPNLRKLFICQSADTRFDVPLIVDVDFLASVCIKLADLSIDQCKIRGSEASIVSSWTPQTFFPMLTHFRSTDSCLGVWAPLIERIPTLASLTLHCCHVGTSVCLYQLILLFYLKNNAFFLLFFFSILNNNRLITLAWNGVKFQNCGQTWKIWSWVSALVLLWPW